MNYDVQTAVPGVLSGMQTAIGGMQEARQNQAQQEALQEGAKLLQSGDPGEVARWNLQNPGLSKQFIQAANIQDSLTQKPLITMAKEVLSGQSGGREAMQERLAEIEAKGGDAGNLRKILDSGDDAAIDRYMRNTLALYSPVAYESFAAATAGAKKEGFTLSEGQERYDEAGNLIAYNPKKINTLEKEMKQSKDAFDKAAKLRGEVEKVSKVYRDVEDSYERIQAASEDNTGASDMALIFNYMKMLDPGSTVREGEFDQAAKTGGLPGYIMSIYKKTKDGSFVTDKQRRDFLSQARKQFKRASDKHNSRLSDYEKLGDRYGLEREDIIISEVEEMEEAGSPTVTTQAEFDALPSGAIFIEDGVQYRKP